MRRTSAISNAVRFLRICLISEDEKRPFSPRSFSSASIYSHSKEFIHTYYGTWCESAHLLLLKLNPLHVEMLSVGASGDGVDRAGELSEKKRFEALLAAFPLFSITPCQIMPTRAHRPTLARTHSRSSSGGSSKVVLNLQLTQKDPVLPKIDKARRTSHNFEVRHCFPSITPTAHPNHLRGARSCYLVSLPFSLRITSSRTIDVQPRF